MSYIFFLGGHDLEMLTIRDLLNKHKHTYIDKNLDWSPKASIYKTEIREALSKHKIPVLIEIEDDVDLGDAAIHIDHHGEQSGNKKPTSLHQVFDLLDLSKQFWTFEYDLVAENDRAYIEGMQRIGACQDDIIRIRSLERKAKGITGEQEKTAVEAINNIEEYCDGLLKVVRLAHNNTSTVADRMHVALGGLGYKNLLVFSPNEVNFVGQGYLVYALAKKYADSWYGGALPKRGFWGSAKNMNSLSFLTSVIELVSDL